VAVAESLLSRLVELYGPPRTIAPHGPSVVIPNVLYTPVLSQDIEKAGLRSFSGQLNGRVAWIVPLNQHRLEDPPGQPGACRFGRLWTEEEDKLLLEALQQDLSMREIGRRLAGRLDRSPRAIETRLRKLAKRSRREEAATPKPSKPPIILVPTEDRVTPALDTQALTSLLSACLCLANWRSPYIIPRIFRDRIDVYVFEPLQETVEYAVPYCTYYMLYTRTMEELKFLRKLIKKGNGKNYLY